MASILSESTNSEDQQQITPLMAEAYTLMCEQRIPESIDAYNRCIALSPKCWRAYQNLGVAYIMAKDFASANNVLKTYIQHVPRDPLGHDSLGVSYSELDDPLQAIASFVNAINLSPGYYMPYYNLGVVLGRLELHDFALSIYQHCLNLQPNYVNALNNVADIFKKLGRVDDAIEVFKQVIEIDPNYLLGIKNLGNCHFAKQDYYSALLTYFEALNVDPENETILHNLALCLDHFRLYNQAAVCVFRSYQHASDQLAPENVVKPYVAGNLFCKYLHQMYQLFRTMVRLKIGIKRDFLNEFISTYHAALECYTVAADLLPACGQVYQNIQITKLNFIGCHIKLNRLAKLIHSAKELNYHSQGKKILRHIKQQQAFECQMAVWRKRTKHILQKIPRPGIKSQQFYQQQQKVVQLVDNQIIPLKHRLNFKRISYVSRSHNHNLKRLILKRKKYISKYNKFNQKVSKLFRYRTPLTTLTDGSEEAERQITQILRGEGG